MFLSDRDIKEAVEAGDIVLTPFEESRLQPASYDILLGNTFVITDPHSTTHIDPVKKVFPKTREVVISNDDTFVLHPGVSILGYSRDHFGSRKYMVEVNGKSSLARIGLLVHNSASLVNPGHFLNIALELCNLNHVPVVLRPGMPIAQLTFSTLSSAPRQEYEKVGRYAKDNIKGYVEPKSGRKTRK
jgi:dCTP deaminase